MRTAKTAAFAGVLTAMSVVLLFVGVIVSPLSYVLPIATGLLMILLIESVSVKSALLTYFSTSFLSFILFGGKETVLFYVFFFGYYPILKAVMESKLRPVLCWVLKIGSFLLTMVVSYFLMIKLMGVTIDEIDEFGVMAIPMLLGLGTFAFVLYDIALSKLVTLYMLKWRKYFKRYFK